MDLLKGMAGKVMTGVVALAVIIGAFTWWSMDPAARQGILQGTGRIIAWFGIVILLPWATFFLIATIARRESNVFGAVLVAAYTLLELLLLVWLFDWSVHGAAAIPPRGSRTGTTRRGTASDPCSARCGSGRAQRT